MTSIRESKGADEIAALIHESLQVVPDLRDVAIVVTRLPELDASGCNWSARATNQGVEASADSLHLVDEIIANAKRHFNLFEMH